MSPTAGTVQRLTAALIVIVAVVGGAACSANSDDASGGGGREGVPTGPISEVTTVTTPVGPVLSDEDGRILYLNTGEADGTPRCVDPDCVELWPPVISTNPVATEGADVELFGSLVRAEGTQLTYRGQPVYRFSGDQSPGQLEGCGTAGRWWPIAPDGDPVRTC